MEIYLTIFFILTVSSIVYFLGSKSLGLLIMTVGLLLLLIITSFREGIGTDFYSYKKIYEEIALNKNSYNVEIGYAFLNILSKYLGGFNSLLFLIALINLLVTGFILRNLRFNLPVGFLTYYSLFFLNHNFNTIRHGLMSSVVWLSIYFYLNRNKLKAVIYLLVSFSFHKLAIVFYPFFFLSRYKVTLISSLLILICTYYASYFLSDLLTAVNFYIITFNSALNYYLTDYYGNEVVKYEFGLGFVLYVIIYFLILKGNKLFEKDSQIIIINRFLFMGICTMIFFSSISIFSERIANTLLISLVFIFASISTIKVSYINRWILLGVILSINFFYLIKILNIKGFDRDYQYVPYQYNILNNF